MFQLTSEIPPMIKIILMMIKCYNY